MGAELALGTRTLYDQGLWYPGAALVRQLVEVEYILYLFAMAPEEADRWMTANDVQSQRMFSSAEMRKRSGGRFDAKEYSNHCNVGGHPRQAGRTLLREWVTPLPHKKGAFFDRSALWIDLAQHLERSWSLFSIGVRQHSPANVYPDRGTRVDAALKTWHTSDPSVGSI